MDWRGETIVRPRVDHETVQSYFIVIIIIIHLYVSLLSPLITESLALYKTGNSIIVNM